MHANQTPQTGFRRAFRNRGKIRWGRFATVGAVATVVALALPVSASSETVTGRDVMRRMQAVRARGDGARKRYQFRMVDRAGAQTFRTANFYRKRCGAHARALVLVHDPPDLAGSAILTHSYPDRAPDMWLYLPELGRVRQLNPFAQSDSLFGSDVSYADLAPVPVDLRTHRLLRIESIDDAETFVVESIPLLPERYSRIVTWISKGFSLPVRFAYHDRDGALLKTGRADDIRIKQGVPTPFRFTMENHQREHRTEVTLLDVDYDAPLPCTRLTKRHLERTP